MKKVLFFLLGLSVLVGCKEAPMVKPPKKPIERAVMIAIYYDLALLEASKYQMYSKSDYEKVGAKEFVFKKYKIDSLQFVENNKFYAASIEDYKNMFAEVEKRLQDKSNTLDTLIKRQQAAKHKRIIKRKHSNALKVVK
ncbi:DUF4296 domain-containing protein [Flavobacterium sp. TSSA_36]|uniref:DUF4296 domain-containing protein n=1 Tax=Flavobacterium sp. TSSA_36 TaxID=3447669 RepID=UPI003F2EE912